MAGKIGLRQQQILKLLLEHKAGLSIDDIAKALNLSRNAIVQHFFSLEKYGYITLSAMNKTAGRPVSIYTLTQQGLNYFPKQYAWFAQLILTDLKEKMGTEGFALYLQKLAQKLALSLEGEFADKTLSERAEKLLAVMTDLGFETRMTMPEKNALPLIEANNCIYHDLAQQHLEVCEFDRTLIALLLGQEIEQISCMAKGQHVCAFRIKQP